MIRKSLKYHLLIVVAALSAALGCTSCSVPVNAELSSAPVENQKDIRPLIDTEGTPGISAQCAQALYTLSGGKEENTMYSPASLVLALEMAEKGASGNTRTQIEAFTGNEEFDLSSETVDVYNLFVSNGTDGAVRMKESYQELLEDDPALYPQGTMCAEGVELTEENQDTLAGELNAKISEITNGQIPSAIDRSLFQNPDFTALLANVIHFDGTWMDTDEYDIKKDYEFVKADETTVSCDALCMEDTGSMRYYEGKGFEAFSVDYKEENGRYRFYGFLPDEEGEMDLTGLDWTNFKEPDGEYRVYVNIPKFEFSSDMSCNSALYNTGLTDLFNVEKADFSEGFEISGEKNVYVSDVVQKTKIRFDEKGTEASAYTGMMLMTTSFEAEIPPAYRLEFDHPFLFLIWDDEENVPLFVGQVYDPGVTS